MPYVVLPPMDRGTRRASADARWTALLTRRPETAAAIALQRKLIGIVLESTETMERAPLSRLSLPPRYLTTKLRSGIPALVGEPIQVPATALRPALLALAHALAETGGDPARKIEAALDDGRLDAGALLTLAARREQAAIRAAATRLGLGHDLLWLIADLATAPYAHLLLRWLFDGTLGGSPLRSELDAWSHGYCPLCGSWPAFVEEVESGRRLRCSFCAAAWEVDGRRCIYCGATGDALVVLIRDAAQPRRSVETCATCRGYAKVIDTAESLPFPLLPLADFESMDLDVLAMRQGCGRPAAKTFGRR